MSIADLPAGGARPAIAGRLARVVHDMLGYGLVSAVALGCDYALLIGLVSLGLHYLLASLVSFSVGMVVAYMLCVRYVFAERRGASRHAEAVGFFAVGVAGLLLTQLLLYLWVSRLALPVALAKVPTTAIVFLFNFFCRRGLVFVGARGR